LFLLVAELLLFNSNLAQTYLFHVGERWVALALESALEPHWLQEPLIKGIGVVYGKVALITLVVVAVLVKMAELFGSTVGTVNKATSQELRLFMLAVAVVVAHTALAALAAEAEALLTLVDLFQVDLGL
jgi:hypothetical protein